MMRTWLKTSVLLVLAGLLGWYVVSKDITHSHGVFHQSQGLPVPSNKEAMETNAISDAINWATVDLFKDSITEKSLKIAANNIKITSGVQKIMGMDIFVRRALPPPEVTSSGQTILLLHGQHYTSQNWEDLGTLALMAALGHAVVAIDLPGYGQSSKYEFTSDRALFLKLTVEALTAHAPVIISPSMSGTFSLPFLEHFASLMSGYVPVAPAGSNSVKPASLDKIMVPTLILYGEDDNTGLETKSLQVLQHLPNNREVVFKEAGHSAYRDQPDLFHKMLFNFLRLLRHS